MLLSIVNVKSRTSELNFERILKRILPFLQNVEYSRRIFGLSWFQLTGLLEKFVDYIMVENRTQQPETASELLPDLKK